MQNLKVKNVILIKLESGKEVLTNIAQLVGEEQNSSIVQGIGALTTAEIGFFDQKTNLKSLELE